MRAGTALPRKPNAYELPRPRKLKLMKMKGTRHDDAPALFSKMLQQGKLAGENRRFLPLIQKAMSDKSGADYGKKAFSFEDAKNYVGAAEEFVAAMKSILE